jgi:toxin ParE1/3/4
VSLPVVLTSEAEADLDEAAHWYEQHSAGLGVDFVRRVRAVLDLIAANPAMYAEVYLDLRRAPVKRFPYGVFFRPRQDTIDVVAVFHNRRDPSIWQARA